MTTAFEELFKDTDVISTYTDADALADGVLVNIAGFAVITTPNGKRVNRATGALFGHYTRKLFGGAMTDVTRLLAVLNNCLAAARFDDEWYIYNDD